MSATSYTMDLTPEELTKAQAASPGAKRFDKCLFNGKALIFRNPTRQEYKQFRTLWSQENGEGPAFEALAGTVCVIPSAQEWEADILEAFPGAGMNPEVVKCLSRLTGMASEETQK